MIDFPALLQTLTGAGARFIIVGGAAATAHGSARLTQDLDVVYGRDADNLRHLAAALAAHDPYLRGVEPGLLFVLDEETLWRGLNFTLVSKLGDLDLLGEIVGGGGFGDLVEHSIELGLLDHHRRRHGSCEVRRNCSELRALQAMRSR